MSTTKETVDFILETLGDKNRFSARAMFGEYALYADEKVVGLICDDQLYVKILPASSSLEGICEQDSPYLGANGKYPKFKTASFTLEVTCFLMLS